MVYDGEISTLAWTNTVPDQFDQQEELSDAGATILGLLIVLSTLWWQVPLTSDYYHCTCSMSWSTFGKRAWPGI